MADINIDIKKTADMARNFDKLVTEYNNAIDKFFHEIEKLSSSGAWVGPEAEKYQSRVLTEEKAKTTYKEFGLAMRNFADVMASTSDELNSCISKTNVN